MLLLTFKVGKEHYGLECREVLEVVPWVDSRPVPLAPAYVIGLFNYRGVMTPLIDLSAMIISRPSKPHFSTRIVVAGYTHAELGRKPLGLLMEGVTATQKCGREDLQPSTVQIGNAAWLGEILVLPDKTVQCIRLTDLLSPELRQLLYSEAASSGSANEGA
jgi:chemotaxis-related protein WspB